MTDAQFIAWLASPTAIRNILVEAVANIAGAETTLCLSRLPYTTGAADTPANTYYAAVVSTGFQFTEKLSISGQGGLSGGDIEISNPSGERDAWLGYVWANRQIQAFVGDPQWARSDYRLIFNGIVSDIDSKAPDKLNLILRDKLQRLNTPVSEVKLGGTTPNKDSVLPLVFGECSNITPLLTNPATLEYQVHNGAVESIFEVRDNGIPVTVTTSNATGKFTLTAQPAGAITASVEGDKPAGAYYTTVSKLIQRVVTGFGKAADAFTAGDLDSTNLAAFDTAHPQPVGAYLGNRENVLATVNMLAASVGAQAVMSRAGQLRLFQISMPPAGTPTLIDESKILSNNGMTTLQISSRPPVVAAIKLGYCQNWTVQPGLLTGIPAQHKDLFAIDWLTATASDSTVKSTYRLNVDPAQFNTALLVNSDAQAEAARQLALWKVPRTVFKFTGTADLLMLGLGDPVTLKHRRFNLSAGVTGMVIGLTPDWNSGHVQVEVLV